MTASPATTASVSAAIPWRSFLLVALVALGLRLALLGLVFGLRQVSWTHFLTESDAGSFLQMARVLVLGADPAGLSFYDRRVFPGWPLVVGALLPFLSAPLALLAATLAAATAVSLGILRLTGSLPCALVAAFLPPVWLTASTHPMAEAAFLACAVAAVLAVVRRSWLLAGLLGAFACLVKPYGIFLALGLAWAAWQDAQRPTALARLVLAAVLPVAAAGALNHLRLGELAPQLHVYGAPLEQVNLRADTARQLGDAAGHWDWPFRALLLTPARLATPLWKLAYVYAHVGALAFLVIRAWRRRAAQAAPWESACRVWLFGNSLASVCAGPYWGFHAFDRYALWCWPAAVALHRDLFARRAWLAALPLSLGAAAFALTR